MVYDANPFPDVVATFSCIGAESDVDPRRLLCYQLGVNVAGYYYCKPSWESNFGEHVGCWRLLELDAKWLPA